MKHGANEVRRLGIVAGGLLGCLPNGNGGAGQPLAQTKTVAQR